MADEKIAKSRTAVLIMDFQNDIVKNATDPAAVLKAAAAVLGGARAAGVPVIHVQHRGGPFAEARPGVEFHADAGPVPGEAVFVKTRTGAFSTTGLDVHLREKGIDTLAMMGVATSGCVLTTVRWAYDLGYRVLVVSDACGDRDDEVHRVLTQKVFPRQATVLSGADLLKALR
jgi:nicotinamidase-related amidase